MFISSDTNVWIDFNEIGQLNIPFRLNYQYYISRDTFVDEFLKSETMKNDLLKYGLQLADVSGEEYEYALSIQSGNPRLSLYDCLALSIAKKRNWILLSGDKALRDVANIEGVDCHGTIWVCDQLERQEKITKEEYGAMMESLIEAVKSGRCRLPMGELQKRKDK